MGVTPCLEFGRDEFRAVVDADLCRQLPTVFELFEHADDACCGQGGVDFDGQHFASAFIEDVECAKASTAVEGVLHEIHGPLMIDLRWSGQGLTNAGRDTLFGASLVIEPHGFVDAIETLMVDSPLLLVEPAIALPEAPASTNARVEHLIDRVDDRSVFRSPVHGFTIPIRTRQTHGTASTRHGNRTFQGEPAYRLSAFGWLQGFFSSSSLRASFSMARSAYMRLSLECSASISLMRLSSEALSPPYLLFH